MKASVTQPFHFTFYRRPSFLLMCVVLGAVVVIDTLVLHISMRITQVPVFTPIYLLRTLLIALGSQAFVSIIMQAGQDETRNAQPAVPISTPLEGMAVGQQRFWIWLVIALGIVFLAVFLISPRLFTYLALEDGIVETFSALGYFVGVGAIIVMVVGLRTYRGPYRNLWIGLALGGAFVLFVMGGEEISWGQRIFNIDTPALFANNHQDEMNLHNYATHTLETAAYSLSVLWLIIIPFINERTSFFTKLRPVSLFVPGRFLIFVGVIAVAYNFSKWDVEPLQFCFFVGLFVLLHFMQADTRTEASRRTVTLLLLLVVGSQIIFLARGTTTARDWDVTEYRELFIPLGYMVYTLDILQRARQLVRGTSATPTA